VSFSLRPQDHLPWLSPEGPSHDFALQNITEEEGTGAEVRFAALLASCCCASLPHPCAACVPRCLSRPVTNDNHPPTQVVAALADHLGVKDEWLLAHLEALKPAAERRDEDVWWV
jgi:hypothetical protein